MRPDRPGDIGAKSRTRSSLWATIKRTRLSLVLLVLALCYCVALAFTSPFTIGADVLVAVPISATAVVAGRSFARRRHRHEEASTLAHLAPGERLGPLLWLAMAVLVCAMELATYLASPRVAHPTLSSMLDAFDRVRALKAITAAIWLAIGGWLLDDDAFCDRPCEHNGKKVKEASLKKPRQGRS